MRAEELNLKYKILRKYITDHLLEQNPLTWITNETLDSLVNTLFSDNMSTAHEQQLQIVYAFLSEVSTEFSTTKHEEFNTILENHYRNSFEINHNMSFNEIILRIYLSMNIANISMFTIISPKIFINLENGITINNDTHYKYNSNIYNDMVVVVQHINNNINVAHYQEKIIWNALLTNDSLAHLDMEHLLQYHRYKENHELSTVLKYINWLSDNDIKSLISIFNNEVYSILPKNNEKAMSYIQTIKDILAHMLPNIPDIAQQIDTAIMLELPLTTIIDTLTHSKIVPVELPELELKNY